MTSTSGASKHKKKKRKTSNNRRRVSFSPLAIILSVLVAVFMGAVVIFFVWYCSFTEIKLSDYLEVSFEGYNKYASATISVVGDSEYPDFFKNVNVYSDSTSNLSNGEELNISFTFDEKLAKENKLRVDATEKTILIEGLPECTEIDKEKLFSGVNLILEGNSPCISAEVENVSEDKFISQVTYQLDTEGIAFLASGETVKVSAEIPEELLKDPAYHIDLTSEDYTNTYTVPEGDNYFTSYTQVTEDMIKTLEKEGLDIITKADAKEYGLRIFQHEAHLKPVFVGNTTTFKWINPYVISAYFHSITDEGRKSKDNHANDVQIVYGVTLTQQDGTSCLTEVVIQFSNLLQYQDGTYDLNLESGRIVSATYRDSNIKKLINGAVEGAYETTKLTE